MVEPKILQPATDVADDVWEQEQALAGWTQHYRQLQPGRFLGRLTEVVAPGIRIFREDTNLRLHQHTAPPPDTLVVAVSALGSAPARLDGKPVGEDDVLVLRGGTLCEFLCNGPMSVLALAIDGWRAEQLRVRMPDPAEVPTSSFSYARSPELRMVLQCMLAATPDLLEQAGVILPLLDHCVSVVEAGVLHAVRPAAVAPSQRQKFVRQFREYVEAYPEERLSVAQVAQAIGVTTRMLEYSFADVMGVSPKDYLKMVRLNAARRALRVADPRSTTVAEIAMDHGFWHLGRFSAYYFQMYGEKPSDTLRANAFP
ncbi:helix-turn-helix domain-containing protein [Azospirillum sp. TSO35-2]|uniref:helix-turn-helix domain-containing protein n=1 Tax=Azospirillum sp. TSO35-2 TaxID=716796 RepID=UPI00130498DA|nr:helix-turn-helix domain-containing protein [Azospirillum sp. TSO35-2]